MKKPNPGQETAGKTQRAADKAILAASGICITYPKSSAQSANSDPADCPVSATCYQAKATP